MDGKRRKKVRLKARRGRIGEYFGIFFFASILSVSFAILPACAGDENRYAERRKKLIDEIWEDVVLTSEWIGKKSLAENVMEAMGKVPRHEFVPDLLRSKAYENRPLPIGYGQTISQPYIVALMTDLLDLKKDDVVLEIGTGSGYQAAILAELVKDVFTIEIIPELGESAKARLKRLGYGNVRVRVGDGYYGWEEGGPFDAVIVTAAAGHIPPPLIEQLKPDGRMVIPVGGPFATQQLVFVKKEKDGSVKTRQILPVRFVPFTGGH